MRHRLDHFCRRRHLFYANAMMTSLTPETNLIRTKALEGLAMLHVGQSIYYFKGHKIRKGTLKLISFIYGSTKPNKEVSGWLKQTKIHFTHIVY